MKKKFLSLYRKENFQYQVYNKIIQPEIEKCGLQSILLLILLNTIVTGDQKMLN